MAEVKRVGIIGGGSAGWLTALFLEKTYKGLDLSVIEDPHSKPIIAGESSTIPFIELLEYIEVDFFDWIYHTDALPKLGGMFFDWGGKSNKFIQPLFSQYLNRWLYRHPEFGESNNFLKTCLILDISLSTIVPSGFLIENKKVPWNESGEMLMKPMYHFDSRKNAEYLKKLGLQRNIKLLQEKILHAHISESGIEYIETETTRLHYDFFIDCSGFSQLLLKKNLKSEFVNYKSFIPNSSVIAWWDESQCLPYTEMHAMEAGWRFNVSLRSRSGNGYIYDNSIINEDQAINEIQLKIGKEIQPIAKMTWSPELCLDPWYKNVLSIGLSNGFLEPLGSPGHTLIAMQLKLFDSIWGGFVDPDESNLYNSTYKKYISDTLDFIVLHYLGSKNTNRFWTDRLKQDNVPDSLHMKMKSLNLGVFSEQQFEVYTMENYLAVMQGLGLIDKMKLTKFVSVRDRNLFEKAKLELDSIKTDITTVFKKCVDVKEWIKRYG